MKIGAARAVEGGGLQLLVLDLMLSVFFGLRVRVRLRLGLRPEIGLLAPAELEHFKDASDQEGQLVVLLLHVGLDVFLQIGLLLKAGLELNKMALGLRLLFIGEDSNFFVQILHVFVNFLDLGLSVPPDPLNLPAKASLLLLEVEPEHSLRLVKLFDLVSVSCDGLLELADCLWVVALAHLGARHVVSNVQVFRVDDWVGVSSVLAALI